MDGRKLLLYGILLAAVCAFQEAGAEQKAGFAEKPAAVRHGTNVDIRFETDRLCDVAVEINDSRGKTVRHLGAGMLGENAPEPFLKNSLRQKISWNGRDDAGRPVLGEKDAETGPYTVCVSLGMRPVLEKYAGRGDQTVELYVKGLAVNKKGELFVMLSDSFGRTEIRVFSCKGTYLRTVIPYSVKVPEERLAPIGRIQVDGERFPIVFSGHAQSFHPLTSGMRNQQMCFSPKGHLLFASAVGTFIEHGLPRYLLALHPEGGAPVETGFTGPRILHPRGMLGGAGEAARYWFDAVAASPDGEWIYLTTSGSMKRKTIPPHHCVFRMKWNDKKPEPFLGEHRTPGSDSSHFNEPRGLAVDADGRIYVCDRKNSRIMLFRPDGTFEGTFDVPSPYIIAVHPQSGNIYVLTREKDKHPKKTHLIKFKKWNSGTEPAAHIKNRSLETMALNPSPSGPTLWVYGKSKKKKLPRGIFPVTDRGDRLDIGSPINNRKGLYYPMYIAADPDRDRVVVTEMRAEQDFLYLKTNKLEYFRNGLASAVDADGNIYMINRYRIQMRRFTPGGKPLPFSGTGKNVIPWFKGKAENGKDFYYNAKAHMCSRGHAVDAQGNIYISFQGFYGPGQVDLYGSDGKRKKVLIRNMPYGSSGVGVDAAGNIYIGTNLRPKEKPLFPFGFDKAVPNKGWVWWREKREKPWSYPYYNAYLYHWGCIFKFPPEGGAFYSKKKKRADEKDKNITMYSTGYLTRNVQVENAVWHCPGFGPIPTAGLNWGDPSCTCFNAHFAVDPFGRTFFPDPFRGSVEVIDTNGNHLLRIGKYGNPDDARPGSTGTDIRFGWPGFVSQARGTIYVSDCVNRQVAVVGITYDETAEIPIGQ